MLVQSDNSADEIKRLRRCINDLVSIVALPAVWTGGSPSQVVGNLLDALVSMLNLDFVYARLGKWGSAEHTEMIRIGGAREPKPQAPEVVERLRPWLTDDPQKIPAVVNNLFDGREIVIVSLQLGLQGEMGILVAGSGRVEFPRQTERLLLNIAANQAVIGLQEANILKELDQRVAQRTVELTSSNEQLREARAALEKALDEIKSSEAQLRDTQAELARVTRVMTMGQLTASIAHEVSQPLSGIVTNASTCLRMLDASPPNLEGAREAARRTIRDGNRASDVVARLRTLYGKRELVPEPIDLNEATREVISLSLSELERNRVVLRQDLAEELPPFMGDRIQIQQVILNLIRNGSDAMSEVDDRPRELTVKTNLDESGGVRLSVKDLGVGIDPVGENKLFEPFYTTKSDGMGIGLSVSRSIIESHRGRLWAVRNKGPGATFLFSIPRGTKAQMGLNID
jgi:signal transduction histidine kinase